MKRNFTIFLLLVFNIVCGNALAQQYDFKVYSVEQGLPQSQVYSILQDKRGLIWGCTFGGGVFSFDGKNFEVYADKQGFDNNTFQVLSDSTGNLYMSGISNFLKYDGNQIINLDSLFLPYLPKGKQIKDYRLKIAADAEGEIWINCQSFQPTYTYLLFNYDGTKITPSKQKIKALTSDSLAWLHTDSKKNTWLYTTSGYYIYKNKELSKQNFAVPPDASFTNPYIVLLQDSQNTIWIQQVETKTNRWGKVYQVKNNEKPVLFNLPEKTLPPNLNLNIFEDSRGQFWFHNGSNVFFSPSLNDETGLVRYANGKFTHFTINNGLPTNNVLMTIEDTEGNLWFATSGGGLFRFSGEKFIHFTKNQGLADELVWKFWEDKNQNLYIGTSSLVGKYDYKNLAFSIVDLKIPYTANSGHRDFKDGLILTNPADTKQGNYIFDGEKVQLLKDFLGLPKEVAFAWRDNISAKGSIVQTNLGTVEYRSKGNFVTQEQDSSLRRFRGRTRFFGSDSKGNEFVGQPDGTVRMYQPNNILREKNDIGIPYVTIKANEKEGISDIQGVAEDQFGNYWFASIGGGVSVYNGKKVIFIGQENGLSSDICYDVIADKEGNIWVSTQKGVDKISIAANGTFQIRNYGKNEGFFGEETNTGAIFEDSQGYLWFGHIKGATRYNPKEDKVNITPPKVYVSNIKLFYQNINWTDSAYQSLHKGVEGWFKLPQKLVLSHELNHISFDFSAISFANPEKVKYQWKLEGADRNWLPPTSRTEAIYANLAPGTYKLLVKAANADGYWTENPTEYVFVIKPPFWATWWFRSLAVFAILGLAYMGIRLRLKALEKERQELEKAVAERTFEVVKQKEEIEAQRDNLTQMNKEINQQKEEMQAQRDEIEKSYFNNKILSEVGKQISNSLSTHKIISTTYENINSLMDAEGFGIGIYNEPCNCLDFEGYMEDGKVLAFHQDSLDKTDCFSAWCFNEQKEIIINDIETEYNKYIANRQKPAIGEVVQSLIYIPLITETKKIGVITVQSFQKNVYSSYRITMLRNIATYVAVAIEKAEAYQFIAAQSKELEGKNEDITASINYASRIQASMLPLLSNIQASFPQSFLFFRPRDIVSGDFYWFYEVPNSQQVLLAAVDCTGHGVPGSLMSIIANSLLNSIIIDKGVYCVSHILNDLHKGIRETLKQDTTDSRDGMDMALCLIDKQKHTAEYAGARNSMYLLTDYRINFTQEEARVFETEKYFLHEVKADRNPIGGFQYEKERVFNKQVIELQADKHNVIVLFSDGLEDQFGGENGRKFMSKNLRNLLLEIQNQEMTEQGRLLAATMDKWMGTKYKQVDDMMLVAVKV
jgi:ligand-binding sensor domain-containing protein/serine phosphatase RsbU (regulator of sigma subunit)